MNGGSHARTYVLGPSRAEHMDRYIDVTSEQRWSPVCGLTIEGVKSANPDPQSLPKEGGKLILFLFS